MAVSPIAYVSLRSLTCWALLSLASSSVFAQSFGEASGFNAVIFGDVQLIGAESEGAIAVGGNLSAQQLYQVAPKAKATLNGVPNIGLYVGGNVQAQNGLRLESGADAYVAGSVNSLMFNGGGQLFNTVDQDFFARTRQRSIQQSNFLASMPGSAINTSDQNNYKFDLATLEGDLKILTITAFDLSRLATLGLQNATGSETVVINVLGGGTVTSGVNANVDGLLQGRVLWNFAEANRVVVGRQFTGSLLAPGAVVEQGALIQGQIFADGWVQTRAEEIHWKPFTGSAPVPEPGVMTALAIAGLAAVSRRRRKRA